MNQTIVTTNLRVPADEWYEFKNFASELNMSANCLVNQVIKKINVKKSFFSDVMGMSIKQLKSGKIERDPIWDWPKLAKQGKPFGTLSPDDKIIYGIK